MNQNQTLKIAIVTNNYKPYSGGLVSSIDSFVSQLRLLGHKVFIITLDFTGEDQKQDDLFCVTCPIRFNYKKNPIAIPWRSNQQIYELLKKLSPDIVHSQHPFLLGVSALYACKKLNIPIVFTYHSQYERYSHYLPFPMFISNTVIRKMVISYCNKVNAIVSPSESTHKYLMQENVKKPVAVIPSGILPIYLSDKFQLRTKNENFHLLTVSRFVQEKNIEFLLDVFSKLDQNRFKFTLIGYGERYEFLKNYAYSTLNLSKERLKFIERPEKEVILSHYQSCDAFIFSSTSETQGLVLAEAMSGGTPVIAVDAPGSCDIVQNGINGFLINSMQEMIQKIELLSTNQTLHQNLQINARQKGISYNNYEMTKKLVNLYNQIVA